MMALANQRFGLLDKIIKQYKKLKLDKSINYNLKVIFPKKKNLPFTNLLQVPQKNETKNLISLGTGLAINQWTQLRKEDEQNLTKKNYALTFASYITDLYEKLKTKYPEIVTDAFIGDLKFENGRCRTNALLDNWLRDGPGYSPKYNTFNIHIWGANNTNFNFKYNTPGHYFGNRWGGGQAECFITQHSGVFGFVSTPYRNSHTVLEKLLNEPDKIWGTDDKIYYNLVNPIDKKIIALNTINEHEILYNKVKKAN